MVARQQLGDIFLGVTPSPIRQYMRDAFTGAKERYTRLIIPCAGRFALAEAAIDAGWDPAKIYMSDITLFSSLIGYMASGQNVDDLGVAFGPDFSDLYARAREGDIFSVRFRLDFSLR